MKRRDWLFLAVVIVMLLAIATCGGVYDGPVEMP